MYIKDNSLIGSGYTRKPFCIDEDIVLKHVNELDCYDDPFDSVHHVTERDKGSFWFRADLVGISISLVSLCFISFAILADKRVRGHPNNIIAYICLCDAYTYC